MHPVKPAVLLCLVPVCLESNDSCTQTLLKLITIVREFWNPTLKKIPRQYCLDPSCCKGIVHRFGPPPNPSGTQLVQPAIKLMMMYWYKLWWRPWRLFPNEAIIYPSQQFWGSPSFRHHVSSQKTQLGRVLRSEHYLRMYTVVQIATLSSYTYLYRWNAFATAATFDLPMS